MYDVASWKWTHGFVQFVLVFQHLILDSINWTETCFADKFVSSLATGFMDRACFAYEVIAIREGQLTLMHDDFSREEADDIIAYLISISAYISVFFFLLFLLCVLV